MAPADVPLRTDNPTALLVAQSIQLYAQLSLQFVVLPGLYDTRAWVVDLRDINHPLSHPYATQAMAEAARHELIHAALLEAMNKAMPGREVPMY
jgi:hypothetical protein